jgi:hypothetical protein
MTFFGQPDGVSSMFVIGKTKGGFVQLALTGGNFAVCGKKSYRTLSSASAKPKPKPKKPIRRLWGSGKGKFTTKGRYASATVRGTIWQVADFCNGTQVTVKRGLVAVQDFVKHKTKLVKAGQTYFAASTGFPKLLGHDPESLLAPVQWHPHLAAEPELGPATVPLDDYVAAQAYAACLIAERCLELDPDRPLAAAHRLRTTTFFGAPFELGADGRQTGHRLSVVQWQSGRRELIDLDAA